MYAWIGVLSLVPFAVILSLPMKNSATSGVHTFLFAGIVAGLIGHAIWLLLEQNIAIRDIYTANFVQLRQLLTGLAFGGGVGFLLYICNHYIRAKRYPKYVKYALASIAGALLFPLIYLLLFRQLNDWIPYAQSSLVGIVVILVMTFSTYVFEERKR